ncbi:hypothetical protein GLOIN_2v1814676 [Rhizophagus irregularis DAOM 181602=DAOM 197198]|nr:hypothetical protein GLOIN_2v1814676 [Rhizophagus irregularis DAOM 181602=DAOM 197198]CAG8711779.1 7847_t:CDS:2 [Rhizophagus irregularis]
MCLNKGLHEEDSDNDEDDPCLILQLISLQVQYSHNLPYIRKYLLFHRARYEPFINTPFWNTLSSFTQKFISDVYAKKKDIQFTSYERSTSDYPITPISSSTDLFVDNSFKSLVPADLNSHNVDYLDSSLENMGSSDIFFDELIEDDLRIDEFMGIMYAAFGLPLVPSTLFRPSSPILASYDDTSLIFLSDSNDELSDFDDESSFLSFDDETLMYYETEWIELFFYSVCFSFIPLYILCFGFD